MTSASLPSVKAYHEFDRVVDQMRDHGADARITDYSPSDYGLARAEEYAALSKQLSLLTTDAGLSAEHVDLELRTSALESLAEGSLDNPHYRMDASIAQWTRLIQHAHKLPASKLASAIDECGAYAVEALKDPRSKELIARAQLFDRRSESLFKRAFGHSDAPGMAVCQERITSAMKSHVRSLSDLPLPSAREKVLGVKRVPTMKDLQKKFGWEKGKEPLSAPKFESNGGMG